MKLLHIDSSILGDQSVSRLLSAEIAARQAALHPGLEITTRDLSTDSTLHLSGLHLAAMGGAATDAALAADLANGNRYLEELLATDILVVGAPMYNFAIPSQLKAWIDRVVVAGKTFAYGASGPEGLLKGKKAYIASARGGVYSGTSPAAPLDHQETYLQSVLSFIGIKDITIIRAEGLKVGPAERDAAIASARSVIAALAA